MSKKKGGHPRGAAVIASSNAAVTEEAAAAITTTTTTTSAAMGSGGAPKQVCKRKSDTDGMTHKNAKGAATKASASAVDHGNAATTAPAMDH